MRNFGNWRVDWRKKALYLITATHDWCCDGNPRRYDGDMVFHDVPTLSSESLYDFYRDFGPKQAISVFQTHLGTASYVIALSGSVWLLALIDDQTQRPGRFFEEHFCGLRSSSPRARTGHSGDRHGASPFAAPRQQPLYRRRMRRRSGGCCLPPSGCRPALYGDRP